MLLNIVIAGFIIVLFFYILLSSEFIRNKLTFYPDKVTEIPLPSNVKKVNFSTSDGETLEAFLWQHSEKKFYPLVIYFHGNAGNLYHRLDYGQQIFDMDLNVLLVSYRGYSKSTGKPSEKGIYLDGLAAYDYAINQLGLKEKEIILFGRSLGSTVAVHMGQNRDFKGIILVTPLSSGREMAQAMGLGLFKYVAGNSYNSVEKINDLRSRLLIIHGDKDEVVPYKMGQKLMEAYPGEKQFVTIKGAGHNNLTHKTDFGVLFL